MKETITIVDYRAGNLTSVRFAVEKLGHKALITSDPGAVRNATRLIFPGVGAAEAAMDTLASLGLTQALREYALTGRPMLGICLGAQIILDSSEEGDVPCLGLIPGRVARLSVPEGAKVPHMGWNIVEPVREHALWRGLEPESQFYFVHSFAPVPVSEDAAIGKTDYHGTFVSAIAQGNIAACQFHPERSGHVGLQVLENFLSWVPEDAE
jgi:glutamine amidotransferase